MTPAENEFENSLDRFRGGWRRGLWIVAFLGVLAVGIAVLLVFALGDAAFAYPDALRPWIFGIWLLALLACLFLLGRKAWMVDGQAAARAADNAIGNRRRDIEAASDLQQAEGPEGSTHLHGFLKRRALREAAVTLKILPPASRRPGRLLKRALIAVTAVALCALPFLLVKPGPALIAAKRVLFPGADIPPYSPLGFEVDPGEVSVHYGEDAKIEVEITGGKPEETVWFLTRSPGSNKISRARCFQDTESRYAQKLESVTQPVEFAFATGRARSAWHPVDIRLQPKISGVEILVQPPRYSGLKAQRFPLGSETIEALVGSRITLTVHSNRRLGSGTLRTEPIDARQSGDAARATVEGQPGESGELEFILNLVADVGITAEIRDLRGTPGEQPLEFGIRALPDTRPDVAIVSPPPVALATPSSVIPVEVEAEDDISLRKVELIRGLSGYRDRFETLSTDPDGREYTHAAEVDLSRLGAEAGQTLELVLEATDSNPSLLGVATSAPTRIQIITEEAYAERLRVLTTLEEFMARYRALDQALADVKEALEAVKEAEGDPSLEEKAAAAEQKLSEAADLFADVAQDFPIYNMEADVAETAAEIANALQSGKEQFEQAPKEKKPEVAENLLEGLSEFDKPMQDLQDAAEDVAKIAPALDLAARVRALRDRQEKITDDLTELTRELASGNTERAPMLGALAEQEANLKQDLAQLVEDFKKVAPDLPEDGDLRASAEQFLDALEGLGVEQPLGAASAMAREGRSVEATGQAGLALALLDELFQGQEGSCFGGMCQGNGMGEALGGAYAQPNLAQTLDQMLKSLLSKHRQQGEGEGRGQRPGGGRGMGPGMGGGASGDGYAMGGDFPLGAQAYGPDRMRFSEPGETAGGNGGGGEAGKGVGTAEAESENIQANSDGNDSRGGVDLRRVPESYREAVKHFFSGEDESG